MPADALGTAEAVLSRQRRIGLRVALAVATGLTWNVATGAIIPFFGPVLAVQFLILGAGPLPLSKAVAFVGLVLVVGQGFITINGLFGDHPIQLLMLLGFFYFVCFLVQARGQGGPVIFLCLTIAIVVGREGALTSGKAYAEARGAPPRGVSVARASLRMRP